MGKRKTLSRLEALRRPELETDSYFKLKPWIRDALLDGDGLEPRIEAWSFVPHPKVIRALGGRTEVQRRIMAIDARRARYYWPVSEFLSRQRWNVSSYFSGGSADFICDINMTALEYDAFLSLLVQTLVACGAGHVSGNDVRKLISVWRVTDTHVLCGQPLDEFGAPKASAIAKLDPVLFEAALRNYRDSRTAALFKRRGRQVAEYLSSLKSDKILVCYRVVTDYSSYFNRDLVPIQQATRVSGDDMTRRIISSSSKSIRLRELLEVSAESYADADEREITHFVINDYDRPRDRIEWKRKIYHGIGDDINVFNYPFEGTLNQTPLVLSDLPDLVNAAAAYDEGKILLGPLVHESLTTTRVHEFPINLPHSSLTCHGVTLGPPGSGKTNADLHLMNQVLAAGAVRTVIALDASGSILGKKDALVDALSARHDHRVSDPGQIQDALSVAMATDGFSVIESDRTLFPGLVTAAFDRISSSDDSTDLDGNRVLRGLIVVEEAADFLEADVGAVRLLATLRKAYRKGWCIWLSLQSAIDLGGGSVASNVLQNLGTRIVFAMGESPSLSIVSDAMAGSDDASVVRRRILALPRYAAACQGSRRTPSGIEVLPAVPVMIPRMQKK